MKTFISDLSRNKFPVAERVSGKMVRRPILNVIQKDHPDFTPDKSLSATELNYYREKYTEHYLERQIGTLTELEKKVLKSLKDNTTLSDKLDGEEDETLTFGQKLADRVADFGGSWTFIISFMIFLLVWMLINVYWLANRAFDPFPFILLNLILSSLAAIQAPVIMMSQNRQEEKDRARGKRDYMVNLKSELEIRMLHEKLDHLIINQQQDILEMYDIQNGMISDILRRIKQ